MASGITAQWPAAAAWVVPTAIMAVVGWWGIGGTILWRDELATWSAASRTVPQLWHLVRHIDAVLAPYYLGQHFWIGVAGDSPTALRGPSLIATAFTAGLVGLTGRRLGGVTAGLASGMVFALIPSVSRYAQEARPYAFAMLFTALATLLLLRAAEQPRWQRWAAYGIAVTAAGASNVLALSLLTGHAVGVTIAWRRAAAASRPRLALGFCLSAMAGVLLDAPLIIEGQRQATRQIGTLLRPSLAQLTGVSGGQWPELFGSVAVLVIVAVFAVLSLAAPSRWAAGYTLGGALVPVVLIWVASQGPSSYWSARYLLFTLPAWAVAAGLGIADVDMHAARLRARHAVATAVVAVVVLFGLHDQQAIRRPQAHNVWTYPEPGWAPADYRGAADVIAARERSGDGIVFQISDGNHWQADTGIDYYLRGKPVPTEIFLARSPAQANSLQPVETSDPAGRLTGAGDPRLWVLYVNHLVPGIYRDPFSAIPRAEAAAMRAAQYEIEGLYEADGITVALMTVR